MRMPSKKAEPKRERDREETEKSILEAAKRVLAKEGSQGFGVNAVAREAGCDKQLVYRYFGGLDGLVDAIGAGLADWWKEKLAPVAAMTPAKTYGELMERLALGVVDALRSDPLVQKIAVWEISDASPAVARLNAARAKGFGMWMAEQRGKLAPPEGVDAPAVNALIVAGVQHMVLASVTAGHFSGAALKTEKDWERVREAVRVVVRGV
jgi:AcrR family transcriptional regulator